MDEKNQEQKIRPLTHEERLKIIMAPLPTFNRYPSSYIGVPGGPVTVKMPYKD